MFIYCQWCQKQRRRSTLRSNAKNDARMVVSTTSLSAAVSTMVLLSMFMNWFQYKDFYLHNDRDVNHYNNFESSRFISDDNHNNHRNNYIEEASRLIRLTHEGKKRNDTSDEYSSRLQKITGIKTKIPEAKDHLTRLALSSEVDIEDLAVVLANKSADVYRPGSWDGAGVVIEEFKLVFFTQGKVACTVFKQLFRRMMHIENWMEDNPDMIHNPKKNGLAYLYHYNIADALTILTHPDWTRAIFVRDPKERLLSAFLDKAARKSGKYVQRHCCNEKSLSCGADASASFLGFLRVIEERCCCDPHWKSQSKRVDDAFKSFINFVGHFDHMQADAKRLLEHLNPSPLIDDQTGMHDKGSDVWTSFGASGWGTYGNESIFSRDTKARHQTSAMTKLRHYFNSTTELLAENLFAADYEDDILNFTRFRISEAPKSKP